MQEVPPVRTSLWQKFVGLFVTWQLVFLVSINLLAFLPLAEADDDELTDSRGHSPDSIRDDRFQALKVVNNTFMAWSEATGQLQAWWLFAPNFPREATFPLVTLHWNHGETPDVRLHSNQEPDDPSYYLRLPGSQDRLFHYEMRLGLGVVGLDKESLETRTVEWRDHFQDRVRRQSKSIRAYLHWHAETYAKEHPELPPPDDIMLSFRVYKSPPPSGTPPTWGPPLEQPLARWLPSLDSDCLFVEFYDPMRHCFTRLATKE